MIKAAFPLTIKVERFNNIIKKPDLISKLRDLTLQPYSGMNYELTNLAKIAEFREVNCKILLAYNKKDLIGWALLSREKSDFIFRNSESPFTGVSGALFQVYVNFSYRRQGVGAELLKMARHQAGSYNLCVCPWDEASTSFYNNNKRSKDKIL